MENTPIREIKPVVVPAQYFVQGPLLAGFASIFPGFFAFVISNMALRSFDPVFSVGILVYLVSFMLCMALMWVKVFQAPSRTTYTIFPDRVEYDEGLWNRHRRTLVFDQVIDLELSEGILQQTQGAGTVTLVTQQLVSAGEGRLSNRRIAFSNVPKPNEFYDLIRSLALKKSEDEHREVR